MIAPRADTDELRARWATGAVRVPGFLTEAAARDVHAQLPLLPHEVEIASGDEPRYRVWRCEWRPCEAACDHVLCALGRALHGDALAWLRVLTGLALSPSPTFRAVRLDKGCYRDPRDVGGRGLAVQLVLTPDANTLDVIDVRGPCVQHVPLVLDHQERRTIEWSALTP